MKTHKKKEVRDMEGYVFRAHKVGKRYKKARGRPGTHVLDDVTLDVKKGEFLILLGPSGCGKSTFLRLLAGFDTPTLGRIDRAPEVTLDATNFVFQNFALLPWLTTAENIETGLIGRGLPPTERAHRVHEVMQQFGLAHFGPHYPHELSGGMRQRVGLARAFVTEPDVLFLDEPFSELDFFTASRLRQDLLAFWQKKGTTIIMVSHYIDEAVTLSDRIAVFSERPGSIVEVVENTLPRSRVERTAEFFALEDRVRSLFNAP
jgi:ABC-type nitrate/sulfonate/bicarbonate transport system ATPase subunit